MKSIIGKILVLHNKVDHKIYRDPVAAYFCAGVGRSVREYIGRIDLNREQIYRKITNEIKQ
jgi:hypothetical protein